MRYIGTVVSTAPGRQKALIKISYMYIQRLVSCLAKCCRLNGGMEAVSEPKRDWRSSLYSTSQ